MDLINTDKTIYEKIKLREKEIEREREIKKMKWKMRKKKGQNSLKGCKIDSLAEKEAKK